MDWFSLLLVAAFILLPIIQQFLEQARKGRDARQEGPVEELDPVQIEPRRRSRESADEEPADRDPIWSGNWAPWPGMDVEEEPDEVEAPVVEGEATFERSREAREVPPTFERATERLPVPIAQPLRRVATAVPMLQQRAPRQRPRTGQGIVRPGLRNPAELRRSIILAEVLGPPIALRQPGGGSCSSTGSGWPIRPPG